MVSVAWLGHLLRLTAFLCVDGFPVFAVVHFRVVLFRLLHVHEIGKHRCFVTIGACFGRGTLGRVSVPVWVLYGDRFCCCTVRLLKKPGNLISVNFRNLTAVGDSVR